MQLTSSKSAWSQCRNAKVQHCSRRVDLADVLGDGAVSFDARIRDVVESRRRFELDTLGMKSWDAGFSSVKEIIARCIDLTRDSYCR
jgi:hypothetical protein